MNLKSALILLSAQLALLAHPAAAQSTAYAIDQDNSILRVYVGRAGILARIGHNHVVHTRELSGEVLVAANPMDSSASFSFPVSSFVVDDPAERERAGDDYGSQPGESAIEGTRDNMLGEDVLDAESFPRIGASVTPLSVSDEAWLLSIALEIQDRSVTLVLPARVVIDGPDLSVNARFSLEHENLGLSPFSAVGGSLRVAEEIEFELELHATAR